MSEQIAAGLVNLQQGLKAIKVQDIMTSPVLTTTEDTTLAELSKIMIEHRISGMPVVGADGGLLGVITSTDMFTVMGLVLSGAVIENARKGVCNPTVKFAMSNLVATITPDTTFDRVIEIMMGKGLHTLPVVESGKIVGVIGRHDVFRHFYTTVRDLAESNLL